MTKRYELTKEIFNRCSGNQMRDIFIDEVELDEAGVENVISEYLTGADVVCERFVTSRGDLIVDINTNGLRQKLTFSEV
ncbi:MAG: hypothetical protein LBT12_01085 [Oscillospiraceae bacterium]|jgi:hypothetical protein|nr:hypothetical protein [Oscillospiraceae bacterium]